MKDRARAEKQRGFKEAVVEEVIEPAHQTECHQRRLTKRNPSKPRAEPQQDNADILQGVVSQQTLDIMFHQRIQTADKRGDHTEHQQRDPPPQRCITAQQ